MSRKVKVLGYNNKIGKVIGYNEKHREGTWI